MCGTARALLLSPDNGIVATYPFTIFRRQAQMHPTKLIGIVLIVAGCLGLAYGGFSYTKETTGVKLGPLELKVQEKETINVPLIVSGAAVAIGVFLLVGVGRAQ